MRNYDVILSSKHRAWPVMRVATLTLLLGLSNVWSMDNPILSENSTHQQQDHPNILNSLPIQKNGGLIQSYENGDVFVAEHTNARHKNIWMVMEKLNDKNVNFWKEFGKKQVSWSRFNGLGALRNGAPYFVESIEKSPPSDLWVCYVSHAPVTTYGEKNFGDNNEDESSWIEGVVTISTRSDLPVYKPMGIFRTANYVLLENKAKEEEDPETKKKLLDRITPSLSLLMHSYAAKIVNLVAEKMEYTPKNYMITTPAPLMQQIIWAKTPHDKVWIDTQEGLNALREKYKIVTEKDFLESVKKNFNQDPKNQSKNFDDLSERDKKSMFLEIVSESIINYHIKKLMELPFFIIRESKQYENLNQYYPIGWDPRNKISPLSIKRNALNTGSIWTITLSSGGEKEFLPTDTMRAAGGQICPWMTVDADTLAGMYNWYVN